MNALYYVSGYNYDSNEHWRFTVTVPQGPWSKEGAENKVREAYPELRSFKVVYLCKTPDYVFTEL